ncbi:hypothetical protein JXA32_04755 [Candidatus Sumerlaeota bacterium]|nr:hypothetical protein [Candidatus Sumerlaeota bacterium]
MCRAMKNKHARGALWPAVSLCGTLIGLVALGAGCAQVVQLGPGAVSPGIVFTDTRYPNAIHPNQRQIPELTADDIEIIGPIDGEAESSNLLVRYGFSVTSGLRLVTGGGEELLVSEGDSGFGAAFNALARSHNADGIMNQYIDTHVWKLDLLFLRIDRVTTRLGGVGYRLLKQPAVSG